VVLNERERGSLTWDEKLTLEFNGPRPCLETLELERIESVPTVFLAGDSTVTDQPREPSASWGQMLPRWFRPDVAIANHAESGETLKSFISGLRLAKVLSQIRRGDYLFIQFGHNDEKESWPQTYAEARTTYFGLPSRLHRRGTAAWSHAGPHHPTATPPVQPERQDHQFPRRLP
jgi:hypothetical protein